MLLTLRSHLEEGGSNLRVETFGDTQVVPECVFWDKTDASIVEVKGPNGDRRRRPDLVPLLRCHYLYNAVEPVWEDGELHIGRETRIVTADLTVRGVEAGYPDGAEMACQHYGVSSYYTRAFVDEVLRLRPELLNLSCPCHQLYPRDEDVPNYRHMHPHAAELIRQQAITADPLRDTRGKTLWRFALAGGGYFEQEDDYLPGAAISVVLMSVDPDGSRTVVRSCTEHGDG